MVITDLRDKVAIITICRSEALNALNKTTLLDLEKALNNIDLETIRCIIITGDGKSFVAGADVSEMKQMDGKEAKEFSELGNSLFMKIERFPIPIIAAINGFALGGGNELAMACDIRIASDAAVFGQPETGLGIIPGFGGTQRLSRIVGLSKAKEIIYTGKQIKAEEALRIGLVDQVYPVSVMVEKAIEMADNISANAPIAIRCAKEVINKGYNLDIDKALETESDCFSKTFETLDRIEGMSAFIEKRNHNPYTNR